MPRSSFQVEPEISLFQGKMSDLESVLQQKDIELKASETQRTILEQDLATYITECTVSSPVATAGDAHGLLCSCQSCVCVCVFTYLSAYKDRSAGRFHVKTENPLHDN